MAFQFNVEGEAEGAFYLEIADGKITIDGVDLKQYDRASLRKNIAMVLQDTHLFTGTVKDNIRYGKLDATEEEVIAAAGYNPLADDTPDSG